MQLEGNSVKQGKTDVRNPMSNYRLEERTKFFILAPAAWKLIKQAETVIML